jgi:hypothetical protein
MPSAMASLNGALLWMTPDVAYLNARQQAGER